MAIKILLIDDDYDDRAFFCEALDEAAPDIRCYTSADAREALRQLDNKEIEMPDLLFLDINMRGMSGWQCLSILKEHGAYTHIPVIMYSTSSNTEDIEKAYRLGALCFFTKPYSFKDLRKSLAIVAEHLHNDSLSSLMDSSPLFIVPETQA
jgi:CheY-like chemotaxis protein